MRNKFFLLSKMKMLAMFMLLLFFAIVFISLAIIVIVTNMYEEKTIVVCMVFLLGLIATISLLLLCVYLGYFTPNYILNNGIRCKNETINWDEIKITAYSFKQKPTCYLFIDKQYLSGIQNLYKKKRQGFCIALDKSQMENVVTTILCNIKSKVVFLDTDGETETDSPRLSQDLVTPILEHNKRINNTQI